LEFVPHHYFLWSVWGYVNNIGGEMYNWLDDIKVGDEVVVDAAMYRLDRITTVERLTKTQIILCDSTSKFQRTTGWMIGGGWQPSRILEPTEERKQKVVLARKKYFLIKKLGKVDWAKCDVDKLQHIVNILGESR